MKVKCTVILVVLSTLLFSYEVQANFSPALHSNSLKVSSLSFLKESNGPLPIEKVVQLHRAGKFYTHEGNFVNFGRTYQRYWMHFSLGVKDAAEPILYFDNPHIYHLKVFAMIDGQLIQLYNGGSAQVFSQRHFAYRNFVFQLNLSENQFVDYYVLLDRVDEVLKFSVNLYEKQDFMRSYNLNYWLYGSFSGILLFIILFSAFLWLSLKAKIHLWYILYLFLVLVFVLADSGLGYEFLWGQYPELNKYIRTPLGMVAFAVQLHFMQLFISQTKGNSKYFIWVNRCKWFFLTLSLLFLIEVCFKVTVPLIAFKIFQLAFYLAYTTGLLLVFLSLVEKIIQKNKVALIYLLAILTLLVQISIVMLARWNILHVAIDTSLTLTFCILAEVIVLTLGLTFRYNYYKVERNKLEMSLIAQKNLTLTKVLEAIDEEKRRIAEDLHDEVGGTLSVIRGILSNVDKQVDPSLQQKLVRSQGLLDQACKDLRYIAHDLMPVAFNQSSLSREIEEIVNKANMASQTTLFSYLVDGEERALDKRIEMNVFRMVNELIHNIRKHAGANKALVQLTYHADFFQLMVEDDGQGLELQTVEKNGIGLRNLKSRAEYINAEIHIDTGKTGTTIICNVPY